jgi:Ser/Thr protein kinase RdoA (MazF antagonist)
VTFKGETVPDHNHEITEHVAGYSAARRLTEVEKAIVRDMAKAGVTSSQIQTHLKFTTGNELTTAREISNEKAAARKEFLSGRTPVQTATL